MEAASDGGRRTAGKDTPLGLSAKALIQIPPCPDTLAQTHAKAEWWERMMVLMSTVPGLTETAHGKEPELIKKSTRTLHFHFSLLFVDGEPLGI